MTHFEHRPGEIDAFIFALYERAKFRIASLQAQSYLRCRSGKYWRSGSMLDFVLPALGFGLFILSIGYAYACDRL